MERSGDVVKNAAVTPAVFAAGVFWGNRRTQAIKETPKSPTAKTAGATAAQLTSVTLPMK
jgi:hypothetical protein